MDKLHQWGGAPSSPLTAAPAERPAHAVRGLESGGDPPRDTDQSLYTERTE